jgi:hypothetical protein
MGGISQATRGYLESGGVALPNIVSTSSPNPNTVILQWSQVVTLTTFGSTNFTAAYIITPPIGGGAVTVTAAVMTDGTHLQLTTTDQQNGSSYQLNIASGVAQNASLAVNIAAVVFFTGNNVALTVADFKLIDSTRLLITYSRAVQPSTAAVPANYVFAPPLVVDLVERVADTIYLVRTARMQPNTLYSVTISNVRALDGSLI